LFQLTVLEDAAAGIEPIDSIIDWNDPKWADVKDIADSLIYKGEHYIAPLGYAFSDTQVLMYNKSLVEEEGLEDPYELYLKGEWDWDHFTGMMNEFVSRCKEKGVDKIVAHYYPTVKNAMVKDFYGDYGFTLESEDAEGNRTYTINVADYEQKPVHIEI
jgi:ABC-type glycerol-3-phosphate transport system substrate-binding protein